MNYKRIYKQIIEKRKLEEPKDTYTENHHIVPRSLGGSDDKDNLVKLTAREHFICHYLLAKMYEKESIEWYKMNHAFMMMRCQSITNDRYFNSRLYASLKDNFSSVMSYLQTGSRNNNYGKMWISHIDLQENKMIKKDDVIPDGWAKGRNMWTTPSRNGKLQICPCGKTCSDYKKYCSDKCAQKYKNTQDSIKFIEERTVEAYFWFNKFMESGCSSLKEFIRTSDYNKTDVALSKMFRTYVKEYNSTPRKAYFKQAHMVK